MHRRLGTPGKICDVLVCVECKCCTHGDRNKFVICCLSAHILPHTIYFATFVPMTVDQQEMRHFCDDPVCPDLVWKLSVTDVLFFERSLSLVWLVGDWFWYSSTTTTRAPIPL